MIKLRKQEKELVPEIGDICPFEDKMFLKDIPNKDESKYLIPISEMMNEGVFETLKKLNIDIEDLKQEYECPHTRMKFFSLIPLYLYSDNISKYNNSETFRESILDKEWMWDRCYQDENYYFDLFDELMVGSGYTSYTNRNDGSNEKIVVSIELDNGDELICLTWNWFNK